MRKWEIEQMISEAREKQAAGREIVKTGDGRGDLIGIDVPAGERLVMGPNDVVKVHSTGGLAIGIRLGGAQHHDGQ